jgi:hypothetical protein
MTHDQITGCFILAGSVIAILALALTSFRTIRKIESSGPHTARQTLKKLKEPNSAKQ